MAQQITRDPYLFDFVTLEPGYRERELGRALLAELRRFLLELGTGFASSDSSTRRAGKTVGGWRGSIEDDRLR